MVISSPDPPRPCLRSKYSFASRVARDKDQGRCRAPLALARFVGEDGRVDVTGTAVLHAPPDRVWAALTDPAVLAVSIPGCERLERSGPDAYQFTIVAGIGLLQSSYAGRIAVSDQDEPHSFLLTAAGTGRGGTVRIRARFRLATGAGGSTELTYQAAGQVAGLLACAGQQVITGVARRMAGQFFRSVAARLQDGNAPGPAGSRPGRAVEVVPSPGPARPPGGPGGSPGPAANRVSVREQEALPRIGQELLVTLRRPAPLTD
jgi:uncharacterized protein